MRYAPGAREQVDRFVQADRRGRRALSRPTGRRWLRGCRRGPCRRREPSAVRSGASAAPTATHRGPEAAEKRLERVTSAMDRGVSRHRRTASSRISWPRRRSGTSHATSALELRVSAAISRRRGVPRRRRGRRPRRRRSCDRPPHVGRRRGTPGGRAHPRPARRRAPRAHRDAVEPVGVLLGEEAESSCWPRAGC